MSAPPNDLLAEAAVLGTLLFGTLTVDEIPDLVPDHFFSGKNRLVFQSVRSLHDSAQTVDTVSVCTWLQGEGRLGQVGGLEYLNELMSAVPALGARQLRSYASTVRNRYTTRKLQELARTVLARVEAGVGDPGELIGETAAAIHELAMGRKDDTIVSLRDAVSAAVRLAMESSGRSMTGISTGFIALDGVTGGLHPGELTILAARPAMGKSALAAQIAINVARQKRGVALFSLEMPAEQIAQRLICGVGGVPVSAFRTGTLRDDGWRKITPATVSLAELPMWIDDSGVTTLHELRARARKIQRLAELRSAPLGLVAVDYLQLVNNTADNREQAIAEVSRAMKALAKELSVPVIALSQLNRGVESRSDKRPMLSDLRESGAIEQDADNVIAMYRDSYYNASCDRPTVCEAILLKQRSGPVGLVELGFDGPTVTFRDLAEGE
jgi:replicative DNA helicase